MFETTYRQPALSANRWISFVMQRRQLLGIKVRAEAQSELHEARRLRESSLLPVIPTPLTRHTEVTTV